MIIIILLVIAITLSWKQSPFFLVKLRLVSIDLGLNYIPLRFIFLKNNVFFIPSNDDSSYIYIYIYIYIIQNDLVRRGYDSEGGVVMLCAVFKIDTN